jgi:hypothetical protein
MLILSGVNLKEAGTLFHGLQGIVVKEIKEVGGAIKVVFDDKSMESQAFGLVQEHYNEIFVKMV